PIVHVTDLELAAAGRLKLTDDGPDLGVVAVQPGHGMAAWRLGRLFHDLDDLSVVEAGNAEVSQVAWILKLRQKDARATALGFEVLHHRRDRGLEDVVRKHDDDRVARDELLREAK